MNPLAAPILSRLPNASPGIVAHLLDLPRSVGAAEIADVLAKLPDVDLEGKDEEAIEGLIARSLHSVIKDLSSSLDLSLDEAGNLPGFSFTPKQSDGWDELSAIALNSGSQTKR